MCIPKQFDSVVQECECHRRWQKLTRLGPVPMVGVPRVFDYKLNDCVRRSPPNNALAKRELDAHAVEGSTVVPKLHAAWLCRGNMYLVLSGNVFGQYGGARQSIGSLEGRMAAWAPRRKHHDRRGNLRLIDLLAVHRG